MVMDRVDPRVGSGRITHSMGRVGSGLNVWTHYHFCYGLQVGRVYYIYLSTLTLHADLYCLLAYMILFISFY